MSSAHIIGQDVSRNVSRACASVLVKENTPPFAISYSTEKAHSELTAGNPHHGQARDSTARSPELPYPLVGHIQVFTIYLVSNIVATRRDSGKSGLARTHKGIENELTFKGV